MPQPALVLTVLVDFDPVVPVGRSLPAEMALLGALDPSVPIMGETVPLYLLV